jgi:uncharacterized membrane protein YqjE
MADHQGRPATGGETMGSRRPDGGPLVPADGTGGSYPAPSRSERRGPSETDLRGDSSASIPELLRRLSSEGADLVRQEVALAKAELNEKIEVFQKNLVAMAVGAGLMLAGLLFALWALNTGVTAAVAQVLDPEIAIWLSPLILALLLLGSGWGLITKGKNAVTEEGLIPEESRRSLQEDRRWAETKVEHIKEEVKE